mgnify:CR=1 FL=1
MNDSSLETPNYLTSQKVNQFAKFSSHFGGVTKKYLQKFLQKSFICYFCSLENKFGIIYFKMSLALLENKSVCIKLICKTVLYYKVCAWHVTERINVVTACTLLQNTDM